MLFEMSGITETLGFIGGIIGFAAYAPQLWHIIKEKCSYGLDLMAWGAWVFSILLLIPHTIAVGDMLFIFLQISALVLTLGTFLLAKKYEKRYCNACRNK